MRSQIFLKLTLLTILFVIGCYFITSQSATNTNPKVRIDCFADYDRWNKFSSEEFSFSKPTDLLLVSFDRMDSSVWVFRKNGLEMIIDLGNYSNFTEVHKSKKNYIEDEVSINGFEAKLISFEFNEIEKSEYKQHKFVKAVYFQGFQMNNKMTFWINYDESIKESDVCTIINSISFQP